MGVNLTIPATFEDALSTPEQIEWLYRNKESLLQAGANIEITRSGDRTIITAVGEGFSPTVEVEEITGGHRVTITDGDGPHVFDVMDGVDGTSVTVTSASITGGHRLTIVSASGTTTVDVMDGTDGSDGADGDSIVVKSVDAVEGGVNLTVTDKNGDHVIFLMNGPQGLTGPAATIQVGSTTTGQPGSNASVTNVGTSSNAVFNFAIPAGADGQDGSDGTDGRNVFIKYADDEPTSDEDMKDVPSAWIGIYNGTATSAPAHYTSYQWYNFKGAPGTDGDDGAAASVTVGSTTTGSAGTNASVTNSGSSSAAVLDFVIPRGADGQDGTDGAAATIEVGTVTTGAAGSSASVTNSGTSAAAVFDFVIPKGDKGDTGSQGPAGLGTVTVGTTTTGAAGTSASVTNSGTSQDAILNFTIPQGAAGQDGQDGADGADGAAATIAVGTVTTGAAGSSATVTNSGTSSAAVFDFSIPKGDKGDTGAGVPSGGSAGQILSKTNATDYNCQWKTVGFLPTGGTAGQVLKKSSSTNYDAAWSAVNETIPLYVPCNSTGYKSKYYVELFQTSSSASNLRANMALSESACKVRLKKVPQYYYSSGSVKSENVLYFDRCEITGTLRNGSTAISNQTYVEFCIYGSNSSGTKEDIYWLTESGLQGWSSVSGNYYAEGVMDCGGNAWIPVYAEVWSGSGYQNNALIIRVYPAGAAGSRTISIGAGSYVKFILK